MSTLDNVTPEQIIHNLLSNETPDVFYQGHFSWTHDSFPQEDSKEELRNVLRTRSLLRRFIKLSSLRPNSSCVTSGSADLCSVLAGSWRPPSLPPDLWSALGYPNNLGWMLVSGEHTGSQLHTDPDLMGAWSLLLSGAKWWVIIPHELPVEEMTCALECSPQYHNQSLSSPWFSHILPQLMERR